MKKLALGLSSIFLVCFLAFAGTNFDDYVKVIKNFYKAKQVEKEVVQNWQNGIKESYGYSVEYITIEFECIDAKETTDDRVLIAGVTTVTAFCITQDGQKMRVMQMVAMAFLLTKDKKLDKGLRIQDAPRHILKPGWDDKIAT